VVCVWTDTYTLTHTPIHTHTCTRTHVYKCVPHMHSQLAADARVAVAAQEAVEAKAEAMASQVRRMAEEGAALRAELAQVRAAATAQAEARASAEVRAEAAVAHTEMIEAHAAESAARASIPAVWMPPACITPPRLTWEAHHRQAPMSPTVHMAEGGSGISVNLRQSPPMLDLFGAPIVLSFAVHALLLARYTAGSARDEVLALTSHISYHLRRLKQAAAGRPTFETTHNEDGHACGHWLDLVPFFLRADPHRVKAHPSPSPRPRPDPNPNSGCLPYSGRADGGTPKYYDAESAHGNSQLDGDSQQDGGAPAPLERRPVAAAPSPPRQGFAGSCHETPSQGGASQAEELGREPLKLSQLMWIQVKTQAEELYRLPLALLLLLVAALCALCHLTAHYPYAHGGPLLRAGLGKARHIYSSLDRPKHAQVGSKWVSQRIVWRRLWVRAATAVGVRGSAGMSAGIGRLAGQLAPEEKEHASPMTRIVAV